MLFHIDLSSGRLLTLQQTNSSSGNLYRFFFYSQDDEAPLCAQLGMPALEIASEIPQEADFREMQEHLSRMRSERQTRQNTFDKFRQRLFPLLESLERGADGELETEIVWAVDDCRLPLTTDNLEAMERRLAQLQSEEEGNMAEAEKLRTRLGRLWARLEVSKGGAGPPVLGSKVHEYQGALKS